MRKGTDAETWNKSAIVVNVNGVGSLQQPDSPTVDDGFGCMVRRSGGQYSVSGSKQRKENIYFSLSFSNTKDSGKGDNLLTHIFTIHLDTHNSSHRYVEKTWIGDEDVKNPFLSTPFHTNPHPRTTLFNTLINTLFPDFCRKRQRLFPQHP
jgi:hypothetical protein